MTTLGNSHELNKLGERLLTSGVLFSKILKTKCSHIPFRELESLNEENQHLWQQNWFLVSKAFEKLQLGIDQTTRSLMSAGDVAAAIDFLEEVYEYFIEHIEHVNTPKNSYALRFKRKQRAKRRKPALYVIRPITKRKKNVEKVSAKPNRISSVSNKSPPVVKNKVQYSNHVSPSKSSVSSKNVSPAKKSDLNTNRSLYTVVSAKDSPTKSARSLFDKEVLKAEITYVDSTPRELQFDEKKLQDVSRAKTCLDFLVITLCNTMNVKSKDAVLLLTVKSKELSKWIADGKHKEYKEVIEWFKEIHSKVGFNNFLLIT